MDKRTNKPSIKSNFAFSPKVIANFFVNNRVVLLKIADISGCARLPEWTSGNILFSDLFLTFREYLTVGKPVSEF